MSLVASASVHSLPMLCLSAFVWQETFQFNRKMDWQWQLTRMTTAFDLDLEASVSCPPDGTAQPSAAPVLHCWVLRLLIKCARAWNELNGLGLIRSVLLLFCAVCIHPVVYLKFQQIWRWGGVHILWIGVCVSKFRGCKGGVAESLTVKYCILWTHSVEQSAVYSTWQARFYVGAGEAPNLRLCPKSLVTAPVCSSKTGKQLYRGRFCGLDLLIW